MAAGCTLCVQLGRGQLPAGRRVPARRLSAVAASPPGRPAGLQRDVRVISTYRASVSGTGHAAATSLDDRWEEALWASAPPRRSPNA